MSDVNRKMSSLIRGTNGGILRLDDKNTVKLKGASLLPCGNQLFLKVAFEGGDGAWLGKVKGTVIFQAVPHLDVRSQVLSFRNIDFTPDTKSTLKGAALEITTALLKPVIIDTLQRRLVVDLNSALGMAKLKANAMVASLTCPAPLKLTFECKSIQAKGLAVYGNTLYAAFGASGTAKISY